MRLPRSTLVLLVTCSRDESRRDLACAVLRNLLPLLPPAGLESSFVLFDNGSTHREHLDLLPASARCVLSPENIGYWSAIDWVARNAVALFGRDFEFVYIVESDLVHGDLRPLGACEEFLRREPRASGVRTQEFSVRWRWRFDKQLHWLPFHVTRSEVSLRNAVTGEPVWFERADAEAGIYLTNFHPKLPALNRLGALRACLARLAARDAFTEADFFATMMEQHELTGLLDGGLFHALIDRNDRGAVSGSYSSSGDIARIGYLPTRTARIVQAPAGILVRQAEAS